MNTNNKHKPPADKISHFIRDYKGSLPIFFDSEVHVDRMLGQGKASQSSKLGVLCAIPLPHTMANNQILRSTTLD